MARKYGKDDLIWSALAGAAVVYVFKGASIESIILAVPVFAAVAGIWWVFLMFAERIGNWLRDRF